MNIDLVYLWCDGGDKNYRDKLFETQKQLKISYTKEEYNGRSANHNELRYSLRSVEKFAPWIHHIYIITDHQVPDWLDTNHPKITIVDHSEIIPKEYLPTFNSNVIEAFVHKIQGLSEYFLIASDDYFFTRPTDENFFITDDGKPIHYVSFQNQYQDNYYHWILKNAKYWAEKDTNKHINRAVFPSHNMELYCKSKYAECVEHFYEHYRDMMPNKFRKNNDVQRFLYSCWGMMKGQIVWKDVNASINLNKLQYLDILDEKTFSHFINTRKPHLCCINDMSMSNDEDHAFQQQIYQQLFPERSSFEKSDVKQRSYPAPKGIEPAFQKNNVPIAFVVNTDSFKYCTVAICSILEHISAQNNYDIIVFTDNVYNGCLMLLEQMPLPSNVRVRTMPIQSIMKRQHTFFKDVARKEIIQLAKIFIPKLLMNYEKVIFLSADVFVNCDVAKLFDLHPNKAVISGCLDLVAHEISGSKRQRMQKLFDCDNIDDYINLNVLIMNLNELRHMDFEKKVLDTLSSIPTQEQNVAEVVNAVLHGKINLLPIAYSYCEALDYIYPSLYPFFPDSIYQIYKEASDEEAQIIYFLTKPWDKILGKYSLQWWNVAKKSPFYTTIKSHLVK